MSSGEEAGDKPQDPTPKRLEDARKKGEFARSADLNTSAAYAGLALALAAFGAAAVNGMGGVLAGLIGQADQLAPLFLDSPALAGGLIGRVGQALAPLFVLPALAALLSVLGQRALVVTPDKLMPKLSRVSPLSTAKQKFGASGLFEFAKSALKLTVFSLLLAVFLARRLPQVITSMQLSPRMAMAEMARISVEFLLIVVAISSAIGVVDYLWHQFDHRRKNRMSHQELRDEIKQSEGDPHIKGQRRQRGLEIASNRMMADVPKADVVIVNPTHYAVALKWDRSSPGAPVCVAKGVDEIAARIREAALSAGVPIHPDPPTARALHATVKIGQEIRRDHYRAVAAAIRFAEAMRKRARARG